MSERRKPDRGLETHSELAGNRLQNAQRPAGERRSTAEGGPDCRHRGSTVYNREVTSVNTVTTTTRSRRLLALLLLATAALVGCSPGEQNQPPQHLAESPDDRAAVSTSGDSSPASQAQAEREETWDACFLGGSRVGYEHAVIEPENRNGRQLVRIDEESRIVLRRFGQEIAQQIHFTSWETPEGKLVEFVGQIHQGPEPMEIRGQVTGDQLQITTTTRGKSETVTIEWRPQYGGFRAVEQSLAREPMAPGDRRTVYTLLPGFNVVGKTELRARDFGPVELLSGTYQLLQIDTTTTVPGGGAIRGAIWTDRSGNVLKTYTSLLDMETYRTSRAEALAEPAAAKFDLGEDIAVPVARRLDDPHNTHRVRYRVTLEHGDPAAAFVSGVSQEVRSVDEHTAEITVYRVRPGSEPVNENAPNDPPDPADLQPNSYIQSDFPAIVEKAASVAGDETDPWIVAVALERAAHQWITRPNYSQAFATAADVIETREGDCTEHAVLLAALARARKIPARVAAGLVYKDRAFYYHMWTEVFVHDRWIPLDATLGAGGIGAAHLKMVHSSLKGATAFATMIPVVQLIGKLKIEILDVE